MNPVVDTIMLILFVLFMVYLFGGYHRAKYQERYGEDQENENEKKEKGPKEP